MQFFRFFLPAIFAAIALTQIPETKAGNLYRYRDENGVVVLDITVPPEIVKNGYEVLNKNGRVIKVIPPALTPEQIKLRDAAIVEKIKREKARKAQLEKDKELLRLYSHPDDIIIVWKRKLEDINSVIRLKEENIIIQQNKLENYQLDAANAERAGKKVSERLIENMARTRQKILVLTDEVSSHNADIRVQNSYFLGKMKRLIELTKREPSLPIPTLAFPK